MDDKEFHQKLAAMLEGHERFMELVKNAPPPTEEQKEAMRQLLADQQEELRNWRAVQDAKELVEQENARRNAILREEARENDPKYWKRAYERLSEQIAYEKQQRQVVAMLVASAALVAAVAWGLKKIGLL